MSEFQLIEHKHGEYRLVGEITFATVSRALAATAPLFGDGCRLRFDLKDVRRADSAGVALLIEWLRRARQAGGTVCYTHLPEPLKAMIRVGGMAELLPVDSSLS